MELICALQDSPSDSLPGENIAFAVERDLPFRKEKMACDKAERLFLANHQPDKAELLKSLGEFICSVYFLDGQIDTFHGPLLPSTGYLKVFDIVPFAEGMVSCTAVEASSSF